MAVNCAPLTQRRQRNPSLTQPNAPPTHPPILHRQVWTPARPQRHPDHCLPVECTPPVVPQPAGWGGVRGGWGGAEHLCTLCLCGTYVCRLSSTPSHPPTPGPICRAGRVPCLAGWRRKQSWRLQGRGSRMQRPGWRSGPRRGCELETPGPSTGSCLLPCSEQHICFLCLFSAYLSLAPSPPPPQPLFKYPCRCRRLSSCPLLSPTACPRAAVTGCLQGAAARQCEKSGALRCIGSLSGIQPVRENCSRGSCREAAAVSAGKELPARAPGRAVG